MNWFKKKEKKEKKEWELSPEDKNLIDRSVIDMNIAMYEATTDIKKIFKTYKTENIRFNLIGKSWCFSPYQYLSLNCHIDNVDVINNYMINELERGSPLFYGSTKIEVIKDEYYFEIKGFNYQLTKNNNKEL